MLMNLNFLIKFRIELQNRLPWLAIKEKPISDTASNATDATQNNATVA